MNKQSSSPKHSDSKRSLSPKHSYSKRSRLEKSNNDKRANRYKSGDNEDHHKKDRYGFNKYKGRREWDYEKREDLRDADNKDDRRRNSRRYRERSKERSNERSPEVRKFKEEFQIKDNCKDEKENNEKEDKNEDEKSETEIETSSNTLMSLATEYEETKYPCKKRHAILMGFSGEGYHGMMKNPGVKTIEEELIKAMVKVDLIKPENGIDIKKTSFQRASRTDKGVSAARQVCSVNLHASDLPKQVEQLNKELPDNIIIYDIIRATKNFDSHKFASSRIYEYMCPTFAFAPTLGDTWSGYRISNEHLEKVRGTLLNFKGTKNFFNYTSNMKHCDPSCFRFIRDISCSDPFEDEGMEWVKIVLHGDSFIYHQIRKIIGMTITILRNVCPVDHLDKSFLKERCDVPLAPGLGLILNEVRMDRYNIKFGNKGQHEPLLFDKYETIIKEFKKNHIESVILKKEKTSNSMFNWLETLKNHKFYTGNVLPESLTGANKSAESLKPVIYSGNIVVKPRPTVNDILNANSIIKENAPGTDDISCVDMIVDEENSENSSDNVDSLAII